MKAAISRKSVFASLGIGAIGLVVGGFFSNCLQLITDANVPYNDFGWAIPGIISGFLLCFLGSLFYLWSIKNRSVHNIRRLGVIFGAVSGALSGFVSLFFIDQIVSPGWGSGPDASWGTSLLNSALGGIPGGVIGAIAAVIISDFWGGILLRYINGPPPKQARFDSAPTEKQGAIAGDKSRQNNVTYYKYIGDMKTRLYHKLTCPAVRLIGEEDINWFRSTIEAKRAGFKYCPACTERDADDLTGEH